MRRTFFIILLTLCFLTPAMMPRAEAMDPVTIAILTPVAIKAAQIAAPYVIRGLRSGAAHMMTMGQDFIGIFKLPLGILQSTVGIPFGQLSYGPRNIVQGAIAPFKLTLKILLLPVAFCNISGG